MGTELQVRTATEPGAVAAPDALKTEPAPVPVSMQLLLPSTPWNWPTDSNGTSSAALYEFCSWMPTSASPSEPYSPSTTRFSDGYHLFLQSLASDALTNEALQAFADTRFLTTVMYAQSNQPQLPAWNVSQFPLAWIASVSGGSSTAGTIHVALPDQGEQPDAAPGTTCFGVVSPDGTDTAVRLHSGTGQSLDIHADAWGMVSIRPAGWYDGALTVVKRSGPYSAGDAGMFFGADGVLRNLLTGMYVALRPTVVASVVPSFAAAVRHAMSPGDSLRVGGLVFDNPTVAATGEDASPGALVSVAASSTSSDTDAVIIGVTVASLAGGTGGAAP